MTARVVRYFPSDRLEEVEALWSPARRNLAARRDEYEEPIEHDHWDWRRKIEQSKRGITLLSAVVFGSEVQGLIGISAKSRDSVLHRGKSCLYVDYLEVAPWNLGSRESRPRLSGTGTALLTEAVLCSESRQSGGRIGLHSLHQAESFYLSRRMSRLGADPNYYDLTYFEYDEAVIEELLAKARRN